MKYLILLLLFITSCTDKKQTADPVVVEPIIAEVIEPEPIVASYDKGLDLILIDAQFKYWYRDLLVDLDGRFPPPPESLEGPSPYCATYWNSSNNTYYHVYSRMEKTNNIQYSLDTNQQYEALLYSGLLEYFSAEDLPILTNSTLSNLADTYFLYAGSISETERLYINSVNNDQYLKELRITDTTMYTSSNYNIIEGVPLDSPIGPVIIINEYNSTNVIYTNKSRVFNMDSTIQEISYPENSKVIESD